MILGIVIRGLAWVLAARLGVEAGQATTISTELVTGASAVIVAGVSIWHSYRGRKALLMTQPPTGN